MHVVQPHSLVYIISWGDLRLALSLQWGWFILPLPTKRLRDVPSRDVRNTRILVASEDWGKKLNQYLSLPHICHNQFSFLIYQKIYALFGLHLLANVPVEFLLVIFNISCQFQFHLCFGFPNAISVGVNSISVFFLAKLK